MCTGKNAVIDCLVKKWPNLFESAFLKPAVPFFVFSQPSDKVALLLDHITRSISTYLGVKGNASTKDVLMARSVDELKVYTDTCHKAHLLSKYELHDDLECFFDAEELHPDIKIILDLDVEEVMARMFARDGPMYKNIETMNRIVRAMKFHYLKYYLRCVKRNTNNVLLLDVKGMTIDHVADIIRDFIAKVKKQGEEYVAEPVAA